MKKIILICGILGQPVFPTLVEAKIPDSRYPIPSLVNYYSTFQIEPPQLSCADLTENAYVEGISNPSLNKYGKLCLYDIREIEWYIDNLEITRHIVKEGNSYYGILRTYNKLTKTTVEHKYMLLRDRIKVETDNFKVNYKSIIYRVTISDEVIYYTKPD